MPGPNTRRSNRPVRAWILYDWANSAFAVTVMAGFFPVFFKQFWSSATDPTVSTFQLGLANSAASIVVALLAPLLGAIADHAGARQRFLLHFAGLAIVTTGALSLVGQGHWLLALVVYAIAVVGFSSANVFYDALLVTVAPAHRWEKVSALGFAVGYVGGGLLFAVNVLMTLQPQLFGLADAATAVRISFAAVAVWWAVFSIPIALWVKDEPTGKRPSGSALTAGWTQLRQTWTHLRRLRPVLVFLAAYWLYIDGVHTVIRMAVDYGLALGFAHQSLIVALLITQFVGFPAAIAFGAIGERLGAKAGLFIGIAVYLAVIVWAYRMQAVWEFYFLAGVMGLVQGGIQALSRSLYAHLIPTEQAGEFFGFYNMLGKFAAVLGPALMGFVGLAAGDPRAGILSVALLFVAGGAVLCFVNETRERIA